jgi:hypothetical protein
MALPYGINSPVQAFVGPDADKPDLSSYHAGDFYLATDTGITYQAVPIGEDGAAIWVAAEGAGSGGSVVTVGLIDLTTVPGGGPISPSDMDYMARALEFQVREHLRPYWPNVGAVRVRVVTDITEFEVDPDLWPHGLVDSASAIDPGSAGIHGWAAPVLPGPGAPPFTASAPFGTAPFGKPWMLTGLAEVSGILVPTVPGAPSLSVIASHETLESVIDPRPFFSRWAPCLFFTTCEALPLGPVGPFNGLKTDGAPFLSTHAMVECCNAVPAIYLVALAGGQLVALHDFCTQDWFFQPLLLPPFRPTPPFPGPPPGTVFDFLGLTSDAFELHPGGYIEIELQRSSMVGEIMAWPAVQQNPWVDPPCAGLPANVDPATLPASPVGPWARVTTRGPIHNAIGQFTSFSSQFFAPSRVPTAPMLITAPRPGGRVALSPSSRGVRILDDAGVAELVARIAADAAPAAVARLAALRAATPTRHAPRRLTLDELRTIYGAARIDNPYGVPQIDAAAPPSPAPSAEDPPPPDPGDKPPPAPPPAAGSLAARAKLRKPRR